MTKAALIGFLLSVVFIAVIQPDTAGGNIVSIVGVTILTMSCYVIGLGVFWLARRMIIDRKETP